MVDYSSASFDEANRTFIEITSQALHNGSSTESMRPGNSVDFYMINYSSDLISMLVAAFAFAFMAYYYIPQTGYIESQIIEDGNSIATADSAGIVQHAKGFF